MAPIVEADLYVIAPAAERRPFSLSASAYRSAGEQGSRIDELVEFMDRAGVDQAGVFVSLRHCPYAASVALVHEAQLFLPEEDQEQILGGPAQSLHRCLATPGRVAPAVSR